MNLCDTTLQSEGHGGRLKNKMSVFNPGRAGQGVAGGALAKMPTPWILRIAAAAVLAVQVAEAPWESSEQKSAPASPPPSNQMLVLRQNGSNTCIGTLYAHGIFTGGIFFFLPGASWGHGQHHCSLLHMRHAPLKVCSVFGWTPIASEQEIFRVCQNMQQFHAFQKRPLYFQSFQ